MGLLNDLTLQQIFTRIAGFLVIMAVHGFTLAACARLLGDRTPQYEGRLTPNPAAHLDFLGLAMAVLFQLGWIRPTRIESKNLKLGRFGLVICTFAGLLAILCLVPLLAWAKPLIVTSLPRTTGLAALGVANGIQQLSIWFVMFNALPIPVVTGSLFISAIAPQADPILRKYNTQISIVFAAVIVSGVALPLLSPLHAGLSALLGT